MPITSAPATITASAPRTESSRTYSSVSGPTGAGQQHHRPARSDAVGERPGNERHQCAARTAGGEQDRAVAAGAIAHALLVERDEGEHPEVDVAAQAEPAEQQRRASGGRRRSGRSSSPAARAGAGASGRRSRRSATRRSWPGSRAASRRRVRTGTATRPPSTAPSAKPMLPPTENSDMPVPRCVAGEHAREPRRLGVVRRHAEARDEDRERARTGSSAPARRRPARSMRERSRTAAAGGACAGRTAGRRVAA